MMQIVDAADAILAFVALMGWVAALTPTEFDDTIVARVKNLLRKLTGRGLPAIVFLIAVGLAGCVEHIAGLAPTQPIDRVDAAARAVHAVRAAGHDPSEKDLLSCITVLAAVEARPEIADAAKLCEGKDDGA
jgi:hypothetical protein